jgi:UDP-N-acetylmuramoyl-L-alanyl-D-glutamate--2,6-diaminopimelate ligase
MTGGVNILIIIWYNEKIFLLEVNVTGYICQTLADLFSQIPISISQTLPQTPITGLAIDSRQVQPGNIYFALSGGTQDGHEFIPSAIQKGAAAVVGTKTIENLPVPYIQVNDTRQTLANCSAAFYRFPARHLTVIGVTGTDGKTTTSNLIYQILLAAGMRAGIISTVNATIDDEVLDTGLHVTTPDAPDVQKYLLRMVAAGLTHVVLETTSHGLAQHRVTGCEFDIGVVTNITHEHLDYHGSYEAYREAKARLFTMLADTGPKSNGNPRTAVLNRDDSSYEYLDSVTKVKKVNYSLNSGADWWADEIEYLPNQTRFTARSGERHVYIQTSLVGGYNVSNCLAAIAATADGLKIDLPTVQRGIASLSGVPGRMENISLGQPFTAIVDFAHTPNALKRAIETARTLTNRKVITVFGSAGLRDREKRRMMAEVSAEMADYTILTAEDPRTESLKGILAEMADGAVSRGGVEGKNFWRVEDRGDAIRQAVRMAKPGDLVMACGKGHEQSMCFITTEYPWDDRTAMRAALSELLGVEGPEMPRLPTSK